MFKKTVQQLFLIPVFGSVLLSQNASANFAPEFQNTSFALAYEEILRVNSDVRHMKFADFDGDGVLEFVVSEANTKKLNLYKQDSNGDYQATTLRQITSSYVDPFYGIDIVDFDGDGDLDILNIERRGDVHFFENDGDENFTLTTFFSRGFTSTDLKALDVDADGDMDIVLLGYSGIGLEWNENDGSNNFTRRTIDSGVGATFFEFVDFEGDGDEDIWLEGGTLFVNDGSFGFTKVAPPATTSLYRDDIAYADVDNDGDQDIVVSQDDDNQPLKLYVNNGSNAFTLGTDIVANVGERRGQIAVGDFNNDNADDMVLIQWHSSSNDTAMSLINDGGGTFSVDNFIANGATFGYGIFDTTFDYNGDGKLDVIYRLEGNSSTGIATLISAEKIDVDVVAGETAVTTIQVTDADNDTLTYSLNGRDAADYSISATGVLTLNTAASWDSDYRNENNSSQVNVTVSDGTEDKILIVNVNVVPSPAAFLESSPLLTGVENTNQVAFDVTLDSTAKVYGLIVKDGSTAPTLAQLIADDASVSADFYATLTSTADITGNDETEVLFDSFSQFASEDDFDFYFVSQKAYRHTPSWASTSAYANSTIIKYDISKDDLNDDDNDGKVNFVDLDDDNDTIPDTHDLGGSNYVVGRNVDATGTPLDADADLVPDFYDINGDGYVVGNYVNAQGVPLDTDNDGIIDFVDLAGVGYVSGSFVNASGIPLDADSDGVPDYFDLNGSGFVAGTWVTATGDAIDTDNDGIADFVETFPAQNDYPVAVGADFVFSYEQLISVTSAVNVVKHADFDNDGVFEIVVSEDNGKVTFNKKDSNGDFQGTVLRTVTASYDEPYGLDIVDLDNDGDLDIVSQERLGRITLYTNDGSENFTVSQIGSGSCCAGGIATFDYDNDGDLDLMTTGYSSQEGLAWWENDNASFTRTVLDTSDSYAYDMSFIDLDGDGDKEIYLPNGVIYNNVNGSFVKLNAPATFNEHNADLDHIDIDNDGDRDFVYTTGSDNGPLKLMLNNGDNTFTAGTDIVSNLGPRQGQIVVGDYNNDGLEDMLLLEWHQVSGDPATSLLNDGQGGFIQAQYDTANTAFGYPKNDLSFDVSGDNIDDAVIIYEGSWNQPWRISAMVSATKMDIYVPNGQMSVRTISATDADGDDMTFSISGTDVSAFTINSNTGVLSFNTAPDVANPSDANTDNTYEISILISDGTATTNLSANITVTPTPAVFTTTPTLTGISSNSNLELNVAVDKDATLYGLVVANNSDAPNEAELVANNAGQDDNFYAVLSGTNSLTADTLANISFATFSQYANEDDFDLYFLATLTANGSTAYSTIVKIDVSKSDLNDDDSDGVINMIDTDDDGDSIPDAYDLNGSNYVVGTYVDANGAPLDSDSDTVYDYFDLNGAGYVAGTHVDSNGAALDTDNDGVPDFVDLNGLAFVAGTHVDATGTPLDTDNDGIPDYWDLNGFAYQVQGAYVDVNGTPIDADNNGVADFYDINSDGFNPGTYVDANGNAIDSDADGIPDYIDLNGPGFTAGVHVNASGIPIDTDGDGVPDFRDLNGYGYTVGNYVDNNGDPLDSDNDGVPDFVETFSGQNDLPVVSGTSFIMTYTDIITVNSDITHFEVFDFDGDGVSEVLVSEQNTKRITLYKKDSNGNYQVTIIARITSSYVDPYYGLDIVDFDGDGDYDILNVERSGQTHLFVNDGNENFTDTPLFRRSFTSTDIKTHDVDGDNDLDIILLGYSGIGLEWHENDGSNNFTRHVINSSTGAVRFELVDFESDGDLDIWLSSGALFVNDGTFNFTIVAAVTSINDYFADIAHIDVDGDGDRDVVFSGDGDNRPLKLYLNNGSNSFTESTDILSDSGPRQGQIAVGDYNQDGTEDIVLVEWHSMAGDPVQVLLNDGSGTFTQSTFNLGTTQFGYGSQDQTFDVNQDGKDDAVIVLEGNSSSVIGAMLSGNRLDTTVASGTTSVSTLSATDADGDDITFSLAGTDQSAFTVNATTGELVFANTPDFDNPADNDANNVYEVQVNVNDGTASAIVSVFVTVTPPPATFVTTPVLTGITNTGALTFEMNTDVDATVYSVLTSDNATAPSVADLVAGNVSGDNDWLFAFNVTTQASTAVEGSLNTLGQLDSSLDYDLYYLTSRTVNGVTVNGAVSNIDISSTQITDTDGDGIIDFIDSDDDGDNVPDATDTFPLDPTETVDTDGDGIGNNADTDDDGDNVADSADAFPLNASETLDTDNDGIGNNTDTDDDGDGVNDSSDAFPLNSRENADLDGDGIGDNADTDRDGDGVENDDDAFPNNASETGDNDGDGIGDVADLDDDNDGIPDTIDPEPLTLDTDGDGVRDDQDAFPNDANESVDSDNDGVGDNSDVFPNDASETVDSDADGVGDNADAFPNDASETLDSDGDGVGDNSDALPLNANETADLDGDGIGDNSDTDRDGDGVANNVDAFPRDPAESVDTDGDGTGNNADTDDDGDGVADMADTFPLDATENSDLDGDGIGDNADTDRDGDGVSNALDTFPLNAAESADLDGDGIGDNGDTDRDGDGVENDVDAFPRDASETLDTDADGIGNNADTDDDGDGVADTADTFPLSATESSDIDGDGIGDNSDSDRDGDGVANEQDVFPNDASETTDLDGDGIGDNADTDRDGDGISNSEDAFPEDDSESLDFDGDGLGDNADAFPNDATETVDTDGDGVGDNSDVFPNDANESADLDMDGVGDNADTDRDGDGVPNTDDVFPDDGFETTDLDGDGIGDNADSDRDGDGVDNFDDAFPDNAAEIGDADGDGIGDNRDEDADNDGIRDEDDLDPLDASISGDLDGDGIDDLIDTDIDGDGIENALDNDANGDGILDDDAANTAPEALDDNAEVTSTEPFLIDVLANDTDINNDPLSVVNVVVDAGSVRVVAEQVEFVAPSNYLGEITIDYTIADSVGDTSQAKVILDVNTYDPSANPPMITAPADVVVNATGLLTQIDLGMASATDGLGASLPVRTVGGMTSFKPGVHTVTWTATDAYGQTATANQIVQVNPIVALEQGRKVTEGQSVVVRFMLNGDAVIYPVTIPYTVSGTADSDDHNLRDGEVQISSGTEVSLEFNTYADNTLEADETITLTLDDNLNLLNNASQTITVVEEVLLPAVNVLVRQAGETRQTISQEDGMVVVKAELDNIVIGDTYTFDWDGFGNATDVDNIANQFTLDVAELSIGSNTFEVNVTNSRGDSVSSSITVIVEEALAVLSAELDSDGDNIPDALEGHADSDGDGIVDYLDNTAEEYVLPTAFGENILSLIQTNPGIKLSIGQIALSSKTLALVEAPDDEGYSNVGGVYEFILSQLPNAGDSVDIVIPQLRPIPFDARYRKYNSTTDLWNEFVVNSRNKLYSMEGEPGVCPAPSAEGWTEGLTEGHWCVKVWIEDGGPNDEDGIANNRIIDPSGTAIELIGNNTLPEPQDDYAETLMGTPVTINVLANDVDADGDLLEIVTASSNAGDVVIQGASLIFYPLANMGGQAVINYAVNDGFGVTSPARVFIDITFNTAPVATNDSVSTDDRTRVVVNVLGNDIDETQGDVLAVTDASITGPGSVVVLSDNQISYTPELGFSGTATITYTVTDTYGAFDTAELSVTVNAFEFVTVESKSGGSMGILTGLFLLMMLCLRKIKYIALVLVGLSVSAQAHAQGNWYIEFGQGKTEIKRSVSDVVGQIADDTVGISQFKQKDTSYVAGVGFQFNEQFSASLGYLNLGDASYGFEDWTTDRNDFIERVSDIYPLAAQGIYMTIAWHIQVMPDVDVVPKIGVFDWRSDYSMAVDGVEVISQSLSGIDPIIGLSMQIKAMDNVFIEPTLERIMLDSNQAPIDNYSVKVKYFF